MKRNFCLYSTKVRADDGDPEAQFKLGEFYRSQGGSFINDAGKYFMKAASQNHVLSQLALGLLYLEWLPDENFREKALFWIEKAAEGGSETARQVLVELGPEDDFRDSCDLLASAEEGDPKAQYELGIALLYGLNGPIDVACGLHFIFTAAVAGHLLAQTRVGANYLFGKFVATDVGEAIKWLFLAAKRSEPYALYCLGYCYHEGIGVPKNEEQSTAYLLQSAQKGNGEAQFQLARFYTEGVGFSPNNEQAEAWCRQAALQGNEKAKEMLNFF